MIREGGSMNFQPGPPTSALALATHIGTHPQTVPDFLIVFTVLWQLLATPLQEQDLKVYALL